MPTLRLLLALSLIALGTTGAAFAISGYFDPRLWPQEAKGPEKSKLEMGALKPRQRFIAIETKAKPAAARPPRRHRCPQPKPATSLTKAPAKNLRLGKDANVQQAAAWWPLSNLLQELGLSHAGAQQIVHVQDADRLAPCRPRTSACALRH